MNIKNGKVNIIFSIIICLIILISILSLYYLNKMNIKDGINGYPIQKNIIDTVRIRTNRELTVKEIKDKEELLKLINRTPLTNNKLKK